MFETDSQAHTHTHRPEQPNPPNPVSQQQIRVCTKNGTFVSKPKKK